MLLERNKPGRFQFCETKTSPTVGHVKEAGEMDYDWSWMGAPKQESLLEINNNYTPSAVNK
ncbi:MAG: hypothetical protein GY739_18500 [Mesoflavibacter sp.]|nr:hypothetical protein [Mesoflavibacter sp.]